LSGGGLRRRLQPGTTIGGKAYPGSVRMLDPSNGKVQSTPNTVYLIKAANGHILNVLNKNRFDFAQPELADGHLYPTNLVAIGEYGPWPPPPAPGAWRRVRLRSARISARSYRRRAPPPRGPRPGLSVERIVAAAVRVAGSEGLAAVSMKRVAVELDTGPMSLYWHVAGHHSRRSAADRSRTPAAPP
jgi:hypothetical protein